MRNVLRVLALSLLATISTLARADVFGIDTIVSGIQTSRSFSSVEDVFDALKNSNFRSINPGYTGVEAAQVNINYRGLPLVTTYPTANSPLLVLNIPSLGITQTFNGDTRDVSQDQLKDYFKHNVDDILGRLSKSLAKNSPVDPIAGNPNSLMSQLVAQDFNNAFGGAATSVKGGESNNLIGVGFGAGQYRQGGINSRAYTVPLSYTYRNDLDPRRQISFQLPITVTDTDGSRGYYIGLGGSYRFPVNDNWTLTPALNYAIAGSLDLGSLAAVGSASLTSSYILPFDAFDVAIGNMVGYYKAMKARSGDYGYDPGVKNTVLRNGVLLSHPINIAGNTMSIEYSLVDTHFLGDDLYVKHFDEIGISLGTNKRATSARAYFRSGASFLFSPNSKGFNVTLGYWF